MSEYNKPRPQDPVAQESKQKVPRIQIVQASQLEVRGLVAQEPVVQGAKALVTLLAYTILCPWFQGL